MKKLSLVLAAALLLGGISFAQTGTSTTTKKGSEKSTTAKKGEMKSTKKTSSKKASSKTKTATPAAK